MVSGQLRNFYHEAKRRKLFGVMALYVIGAWVALQVAATLFPGWKIPGEAIRFIWFGAVALLPAVVVFAWYFDVTSAGIRRTAPPGPEGEALPLSRSDHILLSLLGVAAAGIGLVVFSEISGIRNASPADVRARDMNIPPNSVAVLPFVNISGDESDEYFSDGITEQLLNELTRIPGLHVAARTSSFYFKDRSETMQAMGRQLGVRTLLEGSIRRSGDMVRISAKLINAGNGYHIWSDSFDRRLDDIFLVQDEIANAIAGMLRIELLGTDRERIGRVMTDSVEAFDLYLKAQEARRTVSPISLDESNRLLQEVIALDPEFAEAYDALAYGFLLKSYDGSMSIDDATEQAAGLLSRALNLQPDLEQAHATLGLLKSRLQQYDEANRHYERALELNANYFGGLVNYGFSLVLQSRLKDGSAAYLKAQALDPLNSSLNFNLGGLMMLMGEPDSGLNFMRRALEIDPGLSVPKGAMTHWLGVYGRLVESVENGRAVLAEDSENLWNITSLARSYVYLGMLADARVLLEAAADDFPGNELVQDALADLLFASGDDQFVAYAAKEYQRLDANIGDPLNVVDRKRVYRFALASLMGGDHSAAAVNFHWAAGGESGIASKTYDDMRVLKMLALANRRLDRIEESDRLLRRCLQLANDAAANGWHTPSLFVRIAEIHAIEGDVGSAVTNLERAFEIGWRGLRDIEYGIIWRELQDDAGIARIKIRILEDIEVQRKRLEQPVVALPRPGSIDINAVRSHA